MVALLSFIPDIWHWHYLATFLGLAPASASPAACAALHCLDEKGACTFTHPLGHLLFGFVCFFVLSLQQRLPSYINIGRPLVLRGGEGWYREVCAGVESAG